MKMPVHSSTRVHEGRIVNLRVDEIDNFKGGRRKVEVVEHSGGVAIIAQPQPHQIVLVRQYRHAVGEELWEVPAGMIERGEPTIETASRELLEETGYRAQRLTFLWSMWSTPGFCNERIHFYLADGLTAGEAQPEDDENITVRTWNLDEAWTLVERDELRDSKTQIALAFAMRRAAGLDSAPRP